MSNVDVPVKQVPAEERYASWERVDKGFLSNRVNANMRSLLRGHTDVEEAASEMVETLIDESADYEFIRALEAHRDLAKSFVLGHIIDRFEELR